jgi:hypothetical protein
VPTREQIDLQSHLDGLYPFEDRTGGGPGGAGVWGDITGTLADQTDLQAELDAKDAALAAHEAAGDPHAQYLTEAEATALYDSLGAASAAVASHVGDVDPHPGYLTPSEGNAAYQALDGTLTALAALNSTAGLLEQTGADTFTKRALGVGAGTSVLTRDDGDLRYEDAGAVNDHVALADPHSQYQKESEKDAANGYCGLNGSSVVPHARLGSGGGGSSKFLREDNTWQTVSGSGNPLDSWPVGAIFIAADSVDPNTALGGTWTAFGAGRVLVGQDTGDTAFDTLGETGGVKDVTLTAAQSGLPQHTHVQNPHNHVENNNSATTGALAGWAARDTSTSTSVATGYNTADATTTNQNAGPTDAASAHTNLQPYIVVKFWRRTA